MKKLFFTICVSLFFLSACTEKDPDFEKHNQIKSELQKLVDSTYNNYLKTVPEYPGGLSLKITHDNYSYFVTSGFETSVTSSHHFRAASCTKTFTATAILLLHQQGKLNIEDYVNELIPGTQEPYLPNNSSFDIPNKDSIRIIDLLRHRAGVFDVSNELIPDTISAELPYKGHNYIEYVLKNETGHTFSFDELVKVVAETGLYYFKPDDNYQYSNTGYSLLGKIIERVTKESYRDFLMNNVLKPMGLDESFLAITGSEVDMPKPYVSGYKLYENMIYDVTKSNMSANVAEGNLATTPDDLSRFISQLISGRGVLNTNTISLMTDFIPTGASSSDKYGCGLSYMNNLGFGHTGAHEGYLSLMAYDPEIDFTIVAYTNTWNLNDDFNSLSKQFVELLGNVAVGSKAIIMNIE